MKREVDNEGWVLLPILEVSGVLGSKINASIPPIPLHSSLTNK